MYSFSVIRQFGHFQPVALLSDMISTTSSTSKSDEKNTQLNIASTRKNPRWSPFREPGSRNVLLGSQCGLNAAHRCPALFSAVVMLFPYVSLPVSCITFNHLPIEGDTAGQNLDTGEDLAAVSREAPVHNVSEPLQ